MRLFRSLLSWFPALAVLAALLVFLGPGIQRATRYAELLRQPAPVASSLPDPVSGARYTDTWGGARSQGRRHEGVDIFAPRGAAIRSTSPGVVERIGENSLGGRTVTVTGPGGYHHYYAHLERYPALKVGDWIERGTVVGYVGDSGNAAGTPTHLHYGVYTPGWTAINPYLLLDRRRS